MRIRFGEQVICQDGAAAGTLTRIVLDTEKREVTDIVLGQSDLTEGERLVPISLVEGGTEKGLTLYADVPLVQQLPPFVAAAFADEGAAPGELQREADAFAEAPPSSFRTGGPEGPIRQNAVIIGDDCAVEAIDGTLGSLEEVGLTLYTNALDSITVATRDSSRPRLDVPAPLIGEIGARRIRIMQTVDHARKHVVEEAGPYVTVENDGEGEGEGAAGGSR